MPKILHHDAHFKIELEENSIFVDEKYWGFLFTSDEGQNFVVRHVRRVETLHKELGFLLPLPLATLPHLFEVKLGSKLVHYRFYPARKNRVVRSLPHVFVSLACLEHTPDAVHIPPARRRRL